MQVNLLVHTQTDSPLEIRSMKALLEDSPEPGVDPLIPLWGKPLVYRYKSELLYSGGLVRGQVQ